MTRAGVPVSASPACGRIAVGMGWALLAAGIWRGCGVMRHLAESLRGLGGTFPGCRVGSEPRIPKWDGCRKETGLKVLMCSIVAAGLIATACQIVLTRFVGESSAQAYSTPSTRL